MRVYELGKELGSGSHAVMAAASKLGIAAVAPASGLTEAEVVAIRAAISEEGSDMVRENERVLGEHQVTGEAATGYRLVRKGSVTAGRVRVRKGQVVDEHTFAALPGRVKVWFDQA